MYLALAGACTNIIRKKLDRIKEVITMQEKTLKDTQEAIKDFVQVLLRLSEKDRAVILMNANAFRVRNDIEKSKM